MASLEDLIERESPLDGTLAKISSYDEMVNWLSRKDIFKYTFVTLTFKTIKYNKFSKDRCVSPVLFEEANADDIDSLVTHFFDNHITKIKYFFRLDLSSDKLRWHYHGVVAYDTPLHLKYFITLWNKTFGRCDHSELRNVEKACRYIMGMPKDELVSQSPEDIHLYNNGSKKLSMKEFLDSFVVTNVRQAPLGANINTT